MTGASTLIRSLLIYSICLPLAIFLGYLLATPLDLATFAVVGLVLFLLILPLLLKWHHVLLILWWNTNAVIFFLPGRPGLWLLLTWISFIIALLQFIINPKLQFISAPSIARPLMLLAVVIVVTAKLAGGIGLGSLGSESMGGRRYITLLTAIVAFFAITSQRVPPQHATFYVILFFLGSITNAIGDLAKLINPGFYFIYLLFPISEAGLQSISNDPSMATAGFSRLGGIATASASIISALLCRYGIGGIFKARQALRMLVFVTCVIASLFGGFRSGVILFLLTFSILFYLEGLMRSPLLPIFMVLAIFVSSLALPFMQHLPFSIQRSFSFLPIPLDPEVRMSAQVSTDWRLEIWRNVLPEVPRHLLLGKGYSLTATDVRLAQLGTGNLNGNNSQGSELAGDYHSGPLSLIIALGLPGTFAFLWFLLASFKALSRNYHFGAPAYQQFNTFIFATFIAKTIFFFSVFGSFHNDLASFVGMVALSISLNRGVARPEEVTQATVALAPLKLRPARAIGF
jgi:hypothetical protein